MILTRSQITSAATVNISGTAISGTFMVKPPNPVPEFNRLAERESKNWDFETTYNEPGEITISVKRSSLMFEWFKGLFKRGEIK